MALNSLPAGHFVCPVGACIICTLAILVFSSRKIFVCPDIFHQNDLRSPPQQIASQVLPSPSGSASTGSKFSGRKVRSFDGHLRFASAPIPTGLCQKTDLPRRTGCQKWAVVTTINPPTSAVRSVARLEGWCLVIVGDTKTPSGYLQMANLSGRPEVIFLSAEQQRQFSDAFIQQIPFNSFARKNVGFLFAIWNGAKVIYDFDDDNEIQNELAPLEFLDGNQQDRLLVRSVQEHDPLSAQVAFNPLPYMNSSRPEIWPRGYPVSEIKHQRRIAATTFVSIPSSKVGVVQAVCDSDPDVDAIYRLTRDLPVFFGTDPKIISRLMIPMQKYSPYNAQATTHMYNAFWGLLLPWTVPGRVTDIWRSYITQKIMHELELVLIYDGPLVKHQRSAHEYLADFQAESDLYLKTSALLDLLANWTTDHKLNTFYLPAYLERLIVELYQRDYIGLEDVYGTQEWLLALECVGYSFPSKRQQGLDIQQEPSVESQPLLAAGAMNLGKDGLQYVEAWERENKTLSFDQWLKQNQPLQRVSNETILKLLILNKDEWPLLKDWIWYHGALVGFQNLYILDGSTDSRSLQFLVRVRDHFGVNVIFTSASLNVLPIHIYAIFKSISKSSDFILKMDTDEFLVADKGNSKCHYSESSGPALFPDCRLSPYAVKSIAEDLRNTASGGKLTVGWLAGSQPDSESCRDLKRRTDLTAFPLEATMNVSTFKAVCDVRTCVGLDLGGHHDFWIPPLDQGVQATKLGIIHFHDRCLEDQIDQSRKACISHGFFDQNDSDTVIAQKLRTRYNINETANSCQMTVSNFKGVSETKVFEVWQSVSGCLDPIKHYNYSGARFQNPDFRHFVLEARTRYEPSWKDGSG